MEKLAIIIGPTAVGKTALSIKIASQINAEIISGDSMQVYKGMDIGTAKINTTEMIVNNKIIPHHLLDILEPWESYSVARFQTEAKRIITDINNRGKIPIIVGGTGLYIQSIIDPYQFTEQESDEQYRKELYELAEQHGSFYVHDMLRLVDPISAENIHPNNLKRVIRALEVHHITGKPISSTHVISKASVSPYKFSYIGITTDRQLLYQRIDKRVDEMVKNGLVEEVKRLLELPKKPSQTALQALGYKEIVAYLEGEFSLEEAIKRIKTQTRHFAKRQLTWFRRDQRIKWFFVTKETNLSELASEISLEICRKINVDVE